MIQLYKIVSVFFYITVQSRVDNIIVFAEKVDANSNTDLLFKFVRFLLPIKLIKYKQSIARLKATTTVYVKRERILIAKDILNQLNGLEQYKNMAITQNLNFLLQSPTDEISNLSTLYATTATDLIGNFINKNYKNASLIRNVLQNATFTENVESVKIGLAYNKFNEYNKKIK